MKILVTGARGFVGRWVMKELNASEHTAAAFPGDVRERSTFPKGPFDVITHLAALLTHRQKYSAESLYEVNVQGTKNLLKAYPEAKMVYISTTDVTREQLSEYAKTKLVAEKIVEKRGNSGIIRLPSVFGPRQRQAKLIPLLFRKYCQNGTCIINNNDLREYIYVGDVAKHIVASLDAEGIITLEGFRIRNFELDTMIRIACRGENIPTLAPEERYFFACLEQCVPSYREEEA
jgi:nucleoside-diphosphate-sugar epimerase